MENFRLSIKITYKREESREQGEKSLTKKYREPTKATKHSTQAVLLTNFAAVMWGKWNTGRLDKKGP